MLKNGIIKKKKNREKVGQEHGAQKGEDSVFLRPLKLADNNISNISVPAISASSINRTLRAGAFSDQDSFFFFF